MMDVASIRPYVPVITRIFFSLFRRFFSRSIIKWIPPHCIASFFFSKWTRASSLMDVVLVDFATFRPVTTDCISKWRLRLRFRSVRVWIFSWNDFVVTEFLSLSLSLASVDSVRKERRRELAAGERRDGAGTQTGDADRPHEERQSRTPQPGHLLPGTAGFYRVLLGFTRFYRVLPGFTLLY